MTKTSSALITVLSVISAVLLAFTVGVFVNQYTINDYLFPLFDVGRELGYWQTLLFTSAVHLLLSKQYKSYVEKDQNPEQQGINLFFAVVLYCAAQWAFTNLAIHFTL